MNLVTLPVETIFGLIIAAGGLAALAIDAAYRAGTRRAWRDLEAHRAYRQALSRTARRPRA
jgi:hypothetical protein